MAILSDGQQINQTYEVERFLGEGAFAEVYRVQHKFLGRQAMKVLKNTCDEASEVEELLQEALVLSRIGHPNIVRVFDANVVQSEAGIRGYFTMEFVPGGSLDRYWRSYGSRLMPVKEAVEIVRQAVMGLAVAHSEPIPIVHRDIKPQNLLVGFDGQGLRVRVSDFGLAKQVNPMTLLLSSKGTLGFKPPEAFYNQDSCASDVWALGTTLYLLLTDTMPFPELSDLSFFGSRKSLSPMRPADQFNALVDEDLNEVMRTALSPDPADRYPTAVELLKALNAWQPSDLKKQSESSKSSFTPPLKDQSKTHESKGSAEAKRAEAMRLSRVPGRLDHAADLLEEAIGEDPILRDDYLSLLLLWRRGVLM
jgi:serine/threonine-protein kinase